LQGILGSLEVIHRLHGLGRDAETGRFIESAAGSARRAASLTHRLLAFARRQPLDPRPVAIGTMLAAMEDLLRRTLGENIRLVIAPAADLWSTLCDRSQLESAILNLIINARDAMPEGGRMVVEAFNANLDGTYAAAEPDVTPGEYVCVAVSDTGAGMSADVLSRAFEPFFTTKPFG
jgi:signal transduction histidine kinase